MDGDVQTMQSTQLEENSGNVPDAVYFIHLIIVVASVNKTKFVDGGTKYSK